MATRPCNKTGGPPPPLYDSHPRTPYCQICGRIIGVSFPALRSHSLATHHDPFTGTRRLASACQSQTTARFCSHACRTHRLGPVDQHIEQVLRVLLLAGGENDRRGVSIHDVETAAAADETVKTTTNLTGVEAVDTETERRRRGQARAAYRERVRRAARRAVIWGLGEDGLRYEMVIGGKVVEPSFAKGEFFVRRQNN